jgi:transposase
MHRLMLTDELWSKLSLIMQNNKIYDKPSLRLTVEAILYRLRVGCPWRDLPHEQFGDWNKIYKRFNHWSQSEKLMTIFKTLSKDPDMEWKFIDGSIVKAHQHSSGARKDEERAIGKSVAGNTSKIHMVTDSSGNPVDFEITEGQVHDIQMASELIERTPRSDYTVADKGYDGEYLRWVIRECDSIPVIPKKKNTRSKDIKYDRDVYRHRHLVENLFARLKHFRGIATRFDKLKRNYVGTLAMACAYLWLKL